MFWGVEVVELLVDEMFQQQGVSREFFSKAMMKGRHLYIVFELEERKQNLQRRSQGQWKFTAFNTGRLCQVRNIQSHLEMWSRC